MTVGHRTFRFELRPTAAQRRELERAGGARRFVFNWALERRREYYKAHGESPPRALLYRELTALKRASNHRWLYDFDSQMLQQAVRDVDQSFSNFFEGRAGYPRFKSKKRDRPRFRVLRIQISGDRLQICKIGSIRFRASRAVTGEIRSATFKRGPRGKWFVCILTRFELPQVAPPRPDRIVGLDLGLIEFAVLSDGTRVAAPRLGRGNERHLRRAQRDLARKQRHSRRRRRAAARVAALHARTAARRKDFLHKLSTSVVRRYDGICLESLDARGLARTKLAKSVLDAGWGEFRDQIEYKAMWSGKPVSAVGRYFPSSKLCSMCGRVSEQLERSSRVWRCTCGAVHDRDLNAARNIRAEGIRVLVAAGHADTEYACGAQVRPPTEAPGSEAGIPERECQTGSIPV